MALRDIVKDTDPQLRKKSRDVEIFDAKLGKLLDDMYDTMVKADGVGLAAPQVGILRNVFVIDTGDVFLEAVNPRICAVSGMQNGIEGCLSVVNRNCYVRRPLTVVVEYFDRHGEKVARELTGLAARAFCHEYDHLQGILFYDRECPIEKEEQSI